LEILFEGEAAALLKLKNAGSTKKYPNCFTGNGRFAIRQFGYFLP
jgi:hypothetical protein